MCCCPEKIPQALTVFEFKIFDFDLETF